MPDPVASLVEQLRAAPSLEKAAERLLATLHAAVRRHLIRLDRAEESAAELLRCSLFLRRDGALEGVVIVEGSRTRAGRLVEPSDSAWQALRSAGAPVCIDVETGWIGAPDHGPTRDRHALSDTTRTLFEARSATHALALPVRDADARLRGMIIIELSAPTLAGAHLDLWPQVLPALDPLVAGAAPLLLARPAGATDAAPADPQLPVVGAALAPKVAVLRKLAPYDVTILLSGESGTGKTRLAEWVHLQSARCRHAFVSLDVADLSPSLVEGILFGWKAGAFTDARGDRPGLVEQASGGTLFIDDVDRVPVDIQDKLLRLLDTGRYRVLGDPTERQANLRILAGTNADLEELVRQRRFRADLLFRLGTVRVQVPPLRERRDELGDWARVFLRDHQQARGGSGAVRLAPAAEERLRALPWPGNLRQLNSVLRVAHALAQTGADEVEVDEGHVAEALALSGPALAPDSLLGHLRAAARLYVDEALRRRERGEAPPALDDGKAFKAAIWLEASDRLGTRDGFVLLGEERMVEGRNHGRALSRERQRLAAFVRELGERWEEG